MSGEERKERERERVVYGIKVALVIRGFVIRGF
jgi:hypothetical protein